MPPVDHRPFDLGFFFTGPFLPALRARVSCMGKVRQTVCERAWVAATGISPGTEHAAHSCLAYGWKRAVAAAQVPFRPCLLEHTGMRKQSHRSWRSCRWRDAPVRSAAQGHQRTSPSGRWRACRWTTGCPLSPRPSWPGRHWTEGGPSRHRAQPAQDAGTHRISTLRRRRTEDAMSSALPWEEMEAWQTCGSVKPEAAA